MMDDSDLFFRWVQHYEREFAESPYYHSGRIRVLLQKYFPKQGYEWGV